MDAQQALKEAIFHHDNITTGRCSKIEALVKFTDIPVCDTCDDRAKQDLGTGEILIPLEHKWSGNYHEFREHLK